jgi:hypothetical protein
MNAPTTSVTSDMPHPKWKMLGGTGEKVHPPGGAHDGRWLDVIAPTITANKLTVEEICRGPCFEGPASPWLTQWSYL